MHICAFYLLATDFMFIFKQIHHHKTTTTAYVTCMLAATAVDRPPWCECVPVWGASLCSVLLSYIDPLNHGLVLPVAARGSHAFKWTTQHNEQPYAQQHQWACAVCRTAALTHQICCCDISARLQQVLHHSQAAIVRSPVNGVSRICHGRGNSRQALPESSTVSMWTLHSSPPPP